MSISVQTNLASMQANNNLKINTKNKASAAEKLSSGYRIGKAADDAAGLAISEKLRRQIRGLKRGSQNGQDGVSWVQIGDAALNEVHDILHRMTELTIQSLNDTNTDADRAALQLEYDQLQSEIDTIAGRTTFNTKNIFDDHKEPYYQFTGNIQWNQSQIHAVNPPDNSLTIEYTVDDAAGPQTVTLSVPEGVYTTQELIDELDEAFFEAGLSELLTMEFTEEGTCNLNLEGGTVIDDVSGGLSYLLYDTCSGGSLGALIGTTVFEDDTAKLPIVSGQNDQLSFTVENADGTESQISLTLKNGRYTRSQLIDLLNEELEKAGTTVRATPYAKSIKMASDESIVTGFSGNMFKIDSDGSTTHKTIYTSVFYDNTKYGTVKKTSAEFQGAGIIPSDSRDVEHKTIHIDATNNTLTLSPNGLGTQTVIIPDGDYSLTQMIQTLNDAFDDGNFMLTAGQAMGRYYDGIKITSSLNGLDSEINIDKSQSSAYETLFQNRVYNSYGTKIHPQNETKANQNTVLTSAKTFSAGETVEIISGQNDAFKLSLTSSDGSSSSYTITLDAGTYDSTYLVQQLNSKLNDTAAPSGYKGKLTASVSSNKLIIKSNDGSGITGISAAAAQGAAANTGYNDIFVKTNTSYTTKVLSASGTPPTLTLDTPLGTGAAIDDSNNKLTIRVNGNDQTLTLPSGNDQAAIADTINAAYPGTTITTPNTFQTTTGSGTTSPRTFTRSGSGSEKITGKDSYKATGETEDMEGTVGGYSKNTPAAITIDAAIPADFTVDSSNDRMLLNVNGTEREITIAHGTYHTADDLAGALQSAADASFGTDFGGLTVEAQGSKMVLTARLPEGDRGDETSISCDVATSPFLQSLQVKKSPATITTNVISNTIAIDSASNTFGFRLTENGVARDVSLSLTPGSYNRSQFIDELNRQFSADSIGVTASLYSNCLKLTTNNGGSGYALSLDSSSCGSAGEAIFGPSVTKTVPQISPDQTMQDAITVDDDHNTFSITVNGTLQTVTLDNGTYTRQGFIDNLNLKFQEANIPVTASVSSGKLVLTGTEAGRDKSLSMTYGNGGTVMSALYGETTSTTPKISASFDNDGKLTLTSKNGNPFSVVSGANSYFCPSEEKITYTYPESTAGFISATKSYIDGANLTEPITIDKWNSKLNFRFNHQGSVTAYAITVPEGTYDFASLQTTLQDLIDRIDGTSVSAGTNLMNVTVGSSGVRIEASKPGSQYTFYGFSGNFYDKVICSCTEVNQKLNPVKDVSGTQQTDAAYIVGRKDVKNKTSVIKSGTNDELSLNFSYGNTSKKLSFTLDAGSYDGDSLIAEVQKKLNAALTDAGLPENTILAKIGNLPGNSGSGVAGSNDDNALNFQLNNQISLPDDGTTPAEYIISGVGGNAAFTVFYQTEGDIVNAYVRGTKDISNGVTVTAEDNVLDFKVDGTDYSITIPEGRYSGTEIVEEISNLLTDAGAPLTAELERGNLKLVHTKYGTHKITDIGGSAKSNLFFATEGSTAKEEPVMIQLSSNVGDAIEINRPRMTTSFLGINSTAITRPKYANKSLVRLERALDLVSAARSDFGATQNRLEHAIAGNNNTAENTTAAESRLRDTDMAAYISEHARYTILEQAAEAMQAQANEITEGVLRLLQN